MFVCTSFVNLFVMIKLFYLLKIYLLVNCNLISYEQLSKIEYARYGQEDLLYTEDTQS